MILAIAVLSREAENREEYWQTAELLWIVRLFWPIF